MLHLNLNDSVPYSVHSSNADFNIKFPLLDSYKKYSVMF
jgi:hypothetical protein